MRKKILAAVLGLTIVSSTAMAAIPTEEMNLGGIPLRQRVNGADVKSMYGEPTKQDYGSMQYGDSVSIFLEEGMVTGVNVTANNGWKTLSGLHVGMNGEDAVSMYGTPDDTKTSKNKTLYLYFNDEPSKKCVMGVVTDAEGTIQKIATKTSFMAEWSEWYRNWTQRMLQ